MNYVRNYFIGLGTEFILPSSIQDIQAAIETSQVDIVDEKDFEHPPKESASAPENLGQAEKPIQG